MAVFSKYPSRWGPVVTNKDYELVIESDTYFDNLTLLDGHSLGSPDVDQRDPVSVERTYRENGILIQRLEYVKPALIRSRSYEIGLPRGSFWSPVVKLTMNEGRACFRNVFMRYLCPEMECYEHAFRYPNALFDPISEQDTLIATEDDEEGINATTTLHTTKRMIYYHLNLHEVYSNTGASPEPNYKKAVFAMGDCPDCRDNPHKKIYVVGDDGDTPTVPVILVTDDRFGTVTDQSANIPGAAASVTLNDIYANGDFAIVIGNDATNSEIFYTNDGFDTIALALNPSGGTSFATTIFNKVDVGGGYYWTVGDNGAVYRSSNGFNWTQVTLPAAWATYDFNDLAYDESTGYLYIVGTTGAAAFVMRVDGDTVSNISASVFGSPPAQTLYAVAVLEPDHVAVGGAAGEYWEQIKASVTTPWREGASGTANTIRFIGGDSYRTVLGTDTGAAGAGSIMERSILTDMRFEAMDVAAGFTVDGDFISGDTGKSHFGSNDFVFTTDEAEVYVAKSCLPDA